MIYPIIAYGHPVLKKKAVEITPDYPDLKGLIQSMFDTMYDSAGVGLAAPQINYSIRLFVVDGAPFDDEDASLKEFRKIFINPVMLDESGDRWKFNEGCLSIPGVRDDVERHPNVYMRYYDEIKYEDMAVITGVTTGALKATYHHAVKKIEKYITAD